MFIQTLSRYSYKHAHMASVALFLAFTVIIILIFRSDLPLTNSALSKESGLGIIDVHFNHNAQFVFERINAYGENGRRIYQRFIVLDMVFVFAYGIALSLLISLISLARPTLLNTIPFLASLSDASENICHWLLVSIHPQTPEALATIASSATRFKFIFLALSLLIVLYLGLRACQHHLTQKP